MVSMSKYVLLKSVSELISLKIPKQSCIEYEVIQVMMRELIYSSLACT